MTTSKKVNTRALIQTLRQLSKAMGDDTHAPMADAHAYILTALAQVRSMYQTLLATPSGKRFAQTASIKRGFERAEQELMEHLEELVSRGRNTGKPMVESIGSIDQLASEISRYRGRF